MTSPAPDTRDPSELSRRIVYSPDLDGAADPGEIVWTWVVFEDDPTQGKDRPALVVGRDEQTLLGLMLSSKDYHRDDPNWLSVGTGEWDTRHRESFIRLDRVLLIAEHGIRREGAILPRNRFDVVATELRTRYGWT